MSVGAAAGPAVCTITSVDLEGLDAAVADKDLPGVPSSAGSTR